MQSRFSLQKFKYDRFLNTNGTKKSHFFKDTNKLKYYTLPWGAGANICVGRHFALNAIKQWVVYNLSDMALWIIPLPLGVGQGGYL